MKRLIRSAHAICKQSKAVLFEMRELQTLPGLQGFDCAVVNFSNDKGEFLSLQVPIHPSGYNARRLFIDLLEQHIAKNGVYAFQVNVQNTLQQAKFQAAVFFDPDLGKYTGDHAPLEQILLASPVSDHHATCRFMASIDSEEPDLVANGTPLTFHRNLHIPDILNVDNAKNLSMFYKNITFKMQEPI